MNETTPNKAIVAIIAVVLLAGAGAGGYYLVNADKDPDDNTAIQPDSQTNNENTSDMASDTNSTISESEATYTNGTYEATGSYSSPGGTEKLKVEVTLEDGKIIDSVVTSLASDPTAEQYQDAFISGYKSLVTGKSINEVKLSVVSGSSLTSTGFNRAIEQIQKDAAA